MITVRGQAFTTCLTTVPGILLSPTRTTTMAAIPDQPRIATEVSHTGGVLQGGFISIASVRTGLVVTSPF